VDLRHLRRLCRANLRTIGRFARISRRTVPAKETRSSSGANGITESKISIQAANLIMMVDNELHSRSTMIIPAGWQLTPRVLVGLSFPICQRIWVISEQF
jgi:hypothetical protein